MVKLPFTAGMVLLAILCMLMLASCSDPPPVTEPIRPQPVAQVGELPTVFKGLSNKELARFTDQVNALCDKYSKK